MVCMAKRTPSEINALTEEYGDKLQSGTSTLSKLADVSWTLDYPDLDYPDPRLSGSRTEIVARVYNDLRMRVVAVDQKIGC